MKKADDDDDNYENRRPPETLKLLLSLFTYPTHLVLPK